MKKLHLILVGVACMLAPLAFGQSTIENGVLWYDTQGNQIDAHGAGIMQHNGRFYMLGETRGSGSFSHVNLYSSTDLVNWTFENDVITSNTHAQLADGTRFIERPKLLYNDQTGQFVIWVHWEGENYAPAEAASFYSNTIDGDYTFHWAGRPFDNMSRDCNVFKDDDGTAYFVSSANNNYDLELYELTDDYLDLQSHVTTIYDGDHREAPVIFKRNGVYYLLTSGATGWDPNQGMYSTATSLSGPWSSLSNFGNSTTYDSQPTSYIKIEGSQTTTFIYCGDRWQDPDLPSSKYIWLPLTFNGTDMSMNYYDSWNIDLNTGVVSCNSSSITPYYQINGGSWSSGTSVSIDQGDQITFGPQPLDGSWSWSGCGTSGSSREQTISPGSNCSATATHTNSCGAQSSVTYDITVSGSGGSSGGSGGSSGGGTYQLRNRGTGLYLDGMGRTSNGAAAAQYANTSHPNAQWEMIDAGSSQGTFYYFQNVGTGMKLDGYGRTTNGDDVAQYANTTTHVNAQWIVEQYDGSYYRIENRGTGLYLDGMGRTGNGDACGQYANTTSPNAQWELISMNSAQAEQNSMAEIENAIHIYPNPAIENIHVSLPAGFEGGQIAIYNNVGQLVVSRENIEAGTQTFDLSNFNKGIYIMKVSNSSGTDVMTKKFTKANI